MADTHALATLVQALKGLPGVGIKSAQRMAFQLLQNDRATARQLAAALHHAVEKSAIARAATPSPRPSCVTPASMPPVTAPSCA